MYSLFFGAFILSCWGIMSAVQLPLPTAPRHETEILFGQSAFLSGPFKLYGEFIRNGINSRFARINAAGGIHGKKLRLMTLDDKGEPALSKKNIDQLNKEYGIELFIGNMGTRSELLELPEIKAGKYTFLFPWGNDEKLDKSSLHHLVNGSGNIEPQLKKIADHILNTLQLNTIAIFSSDSDFDLKNQQALVKLCAGKAVTITCATYNRSTMDIKKTAKKLLSADPKVIISLTTSRPTVQLMKHFYEHGYYGTQFIGIDSTFLVPAIAQPRRIPFSYTSSMPHPVTSQLPLVQEYRQDSKQFFPNDPMNVLSLTYYFHAALIEQALRAIEFPLTQDKVIKALESTHNTNIGGFPVNFNGATRFAYNAPVTILS